MNNDTGWTVYDHTTRDFRPARIDELFTTARLIDAARPCAAPMHHACRCVRPYEHPGPCNCSYPNGAPQPAIVLTADHAYITDGDTTHHIIPNFGTP